MTTQLSQSNRDHPQMTTLKKPSRTLQLAAVYNLLWGAVVVLLPEKSFHWAGFDEPAPLSAIVAMYRHDRGGVRHWLRNRRLRLHPPLAHCSGRVAGQDFRADWFLAGGPCR